MKRTSRNKTKNKIMDVVTTVWNDNIKYTIACHPYEKITHIQDKIHDKVWHQIKYEVFLKMIHD